MGFKWVDFKITNRCNNKCRYCGVVHDSIDSDEILTTKEIKDTISDSLKFTHFAFLGGEPSIRENVEDIFSVLETNFKSNVMVITNGLIYNEKLYIALFESEAANSKIIYSFDSFNKPNFKNQDPFEAIKNIKKIKALAQEYSGFEKIRDVEIHSVISRENFMNITKLVEFFSNLSIDVSLALVCPSKFVNNQQSIDYNVFNYKELKVIINQLEELKERKILNFANNVLLNYLRLYPYNKLQMNSICKAGTNHVIINPDGEVYPCITESYRRKLRFGNIRKKRFKDIYPLLGDFKCTNPFAPDCWDHFLWKKLGEKIKREENNGK